MNLTRSRILFAVGIVTAGVFLWLAFRGADFTEIGEALSDANFWFAIPLLITLGLSYWLKAVRWSALLLPLKRTTGCETFPPVMIGYASNLVLPAQLGELVRVYTLSQRLGVRAASVLATVVLERIFDLLTVSLLVGAAILATPDTPPALAIAGKLVGGAGLGMLAACGALLAWTEPFLRGVRSVLFFLPKRFRDLVLRHLRLGAAGLEAIRDTSLVLKVVWCSVLQWAMMGVCTYFSLLAVDIEAPFSAAFVVVAVTVVGLTLPSSPGFFGTIQLGFALALKPFGVGASEAVAASIFWHVLAYVSVLTVGMAFAFRFGLSVKEIRRRADDVAVTRAEPPAF